MAVTFSGEKAPSAKEFKSLHGRAHQGCIIANSIAGCVEVIIKPQLIKSRENR